MKQKHATKHQKKRRKGRRRHVPQRTCVGCRTVRPKRDMLRVVRTPTGAIEIDSSGKQAGRGAYLCRQQSCWETALKRHGLSRALKTTLDDATRATLIAHARTLSLGVATPPRAREQLENLDGG